MTFIDYLLSPKYSDSIEDLNVQNMNNKIEFSIKLVFVWLEQKYPNRLFAMFELNYYKGKLLRGRVINVQPDSCKFNNTNI